MSVYPNKRINVLSRYQHTRVNVLMYPLRYVNVHEVSVLSLTLIHKTLHNSLGSEMGSIKST